MSAVWRIERLGGLRAVGLSRILDRFRTHQTAVLLAFLALYRDRSHPRDALLPELTDPWMLEMRGWLLERRLVSRGRTGGRGG